MAQTGLFQIAQNVTLHVTCPAMRPHHLCDWTLTPIVGELPAADPMG